MTEVHIANGNVEIEVEGWDKFWALKSRLSIPLAHISKVYADPHVADAWWKGLRVMGTQLPGVLTAGTFHHHGDLVFWDVHNNGNAIVLELHDERYAKLIIEVQDPAETVARLQSALPQALS